jgi:uncharacterized protein YceH (UPF0502 family)
VEPDAVEIRVVGCLVEKQRTTPDVYPLSLNALRLACNQATNRDPVVAYDEETIRIALAGLSRRGWARLASGPGSRVVKYRHLLDEALSLSHAEISLLAVLMLRGAQTPGELKQRTDRLHPFASLREVDGVLEQLIGRELVTRLPRRPGQKETRYRHLLSEGATPAEEEASAAGGEDRVAALEARLESVERQLSSLFESLGRSATLDALAVDADQVATIREDEVIAASAAHDVERTVAGEDPVSRRSAEDPV